MTYSQLKNIDAVMAEKELLRSKIAKKEENFSSTYIKAKTFYSEKSNWLKILKAIIFRKTLLSNPISKFSIGFSIAKYLINRFKR